jgi:polyisoprenoid-binding protein YceI
MCADIFKDVHGTLIFDPKSPVGSFVEIVIDARKIWTGEPARDKRISRLMMRVSRV